MKNIIVRIKGGLGNQLFMYAFAKSYALSTKSKLIIDDISGFGKHDIYNSKFILDQFVDGDRYVSRSAYKYIVGSRYFWSVLNRLSWIVKRIYIKEENNDCCNENILSELKPHFLSLVEGYWHSPCYFQEHADELREILQKKLSKKAENNIKGVDNNKVQVAVGLRFFQEVSNPLYYHKMVSKNYYKKSIDEITKKIKKPQFVVFSNNNEKAEDFFNFDVDKIILAPSKSDVDDFNNMKNCKHFIISNSTFHWWAAWLGEANDSIVTVPKGSYKNKDMMPGSWLEL